MRAKLGGGHRPDQVISLSTAAAFLLLIASLRKDQSRGRSLEAPVAFNGRF
jgi:hypothetical protein